MSDGLCRSSHPVYSKCLCDKPEGHPGDHSALVSAKNEPVSTRMQWTRDKDGTEVEVAQLTEEELADLEGQLSEEIYGAISELASLRTVIADVQPPTSIIYHAAQACAHVLMAFERGYRMA